VFFSYFIERKRRAPRRKSQVGNREGGRVVETERRRKGGGTNKNPKQEREGGNISKRSR